MSRNASWNPPAYSRGEVQVEDIRKRWKEAKDNLADWRQEAREDFAFVAGHQWAQDDIAKLKEQGRPAVTFNRIGAMVDAVGGLEINNRQETRYYPREMGDVQANEIFTEAGKWAREQCYAEDEESDAFQDAAICGIGCCLSGDTLVRWPSAHFATVRLYSGSIIKIDLENGKQLTGTPNHPVLTSAGWKGLHELKEGDYLVNSAFLERVKGFPVEQFDEVESRFEDKVNAFRAGRERLRLATTSDNFYSDGGGSDVHVVYAYRSLLDKMLNASVLQQLKKRGLVAWQHAMSSAKLFAERCSCGPTLATESDAAFSGSHAPQAHFSGSDVVAKKEASVAQSDTDSFARLKSALFGNLVRGQLFLKVQLGKLLGWNTGARPTSESPEFNTSATQPLGDGRVRYSNLIGDFLDWKPILEIHARKLLCGDLRLSQYVTRVRRRVVSRVHDFPVHDVGTSLGMFLAADIVTSNTESRMDYDEEPDGKILIERMDPLEVFWDPAAKKKCLADARYVFAARWMDKEEIKAKWPGAEDFFYTEDLKDFETPHNADRAFLYEGDEVDKEVRKNQALVLHYQCYKLEPYYRALDPFINQLVDLDETKFKALQKNVKKMGGSLVEAGRKTGASDIPYVKQRKKVYYRAFLVGDRMLGAEKLERSPCQEGFTLKFITGKRDRNKSEWYGIVRAMKDPQRWGNKFFSQIHDILAKNAKGGAFVEEGALTDPRKAEEQWASANPLILLKEGGIDKIKERSAVNYPTGLDRMMMFSFESMPFVSGINLEALGMANREQAGILEETRKKAAMAILAPLFDALRRYRKEQGRVLLYYIREFLTDGRLIRILGNGGKAKYIPLTKDKGATQYDVIVDQSPSSPDFKEKVWASLNQVLPIMMKNGTPIPPSVFQYSSLPSDVAQELSDASQGKLPPEVEAKIKEMQGALQKAGQELGSLKEENMKLRLDHTVEMAKLQQKAIAESQKLGQKTSEANINAAVERATAMLEAQVGVFKAKLEAQSEKEKTVLDAVTKLHLEAVKAKSKTESDSGSASVTKHADGIAKALASEVGKGMQAIAQAMNKPRKRKGKAKKQPDGSYVLEAEEA